MRFCPPVARFDIDGPGLYAYLNEFYDLISAPPIAEWTQNTMPRMPLVGVGWISGPRPRRPSPHERETMKLYSEAVRAGDADAIARLDLGNTYKDERAAMWASFERRIFRRELDEIAQANQFNDLVCVRHADPEIWRSRGAERLVRRGDALWHKMGAWPWAVLGDVAELPFNWPWWDDDAVWTALESWLDEAWGATRVAQETLASALASQPASSS